MVDESQTSAEETLDALDDVLPELESLYKDVHAHPELSMQETRTAGIAAEWLRDADFDVTTEVGETGVVGELHNGDGPVIMLRADMDALPMAEATDLPYASEETGTDGDGNETPVAHTCGHDMHVAWLAGATALLADARDQWSGTLLPVFQPGEEIAAGAQAMIDDDLFERFPQPDVVLGQHLMKLPAGRIAGRSGVITSAADSLEVRLFGRGAHGSMPEASIDPVVMAASAVVRLQAIVSREIGLSEAAVLTVGSIQAGTKENVIPDEATIKLNVRTFDPDVRERVLNAIERVVTAKPRRRTRRDRRKSRHSTVTTAWKTTPTRPKPSSAPFVRSSRRIRSKRRDRLLRVRTSAVSAASGTFPQCSGLSAERIRSSMLTRKRTVGSGNCRRITALTSRR
jgi:amidohydrolase